MRQATRPSAALAALALALVASAATAADALQARCADGVCVANLDQKAAIAPCAGATLLLAWRQAGGATLIQCETDDADMDKPSLVYNRDLPAGPAFPLTGMRWFASSALADMASGKVADKFAAHALCKPPKPPRMAAGELLIGEKVPTGNDKSPYCYRVLRVATTPAGVAIRADDGDAPASEARHEDWDKLAAKMSALIRANGGAPAPAAAPANGARVVGAKAALRDSPDAGAAAHGYLVQGDTVTVLDRSRAADGWFKVRYVGKTGKAIERWIRADDIDAKAPAAAAVH